MPRPDPFPQICHENLAEVGDAGRVAFQAGRLTAAIVGRLVRLTCRYWRASCASPQKGSIVIPTPTGGRRLSDRDLCQFYGLTISGQQMVRTSRATIGRYHQVFGVAHLAACGHPERVTQLLCELLDGQGDGAGGTIAGILRKARGSSSAPGPAWAAPLRKSLPPAAARARVVANACALLDLMGATEREAAGKRRGRLAALVREVTPAEVAAIGAAYERLAARVGERSAAQATVTPVPPARPAGARPGQAQGPRAPMPSAA